MSEPKFQVGDLVAVFVGEPLIVIPKTTVIYIRIINIGDKVNRWNGISFESSEFGILYEVDAKKGNLILEECLRKIDDDEYEEDEKHQEIDSPYFMVN